MGRRKLTDEEKNQKLKEKVNDFAPLDKDEQLSVFTKTKLSSLSQETIDKYDAKPVGKLSKLSGHKINGFTGKSYADSLSQVQGFLDTHNNDRNSVDKFVWVDYYPQEFLQRSILISYNIVRK